MSKTPKRPRDLNQWAKRMTDIVSGEVEDREPTPEEQGKDPAAVARGAQGRESAPPRDGGRCDEAALGNERRC